jgi:hypothetical protein
MTPTRAFLSRTEAAEYVQSQGLALARGALQKYGAAGGGPRFHKCGQRCVYRREDLDAWIASKLGRPVSSFRESQAAADGRYSQGVPEPGPETCDPAGAPDADR